VSGLALVIANGPAWAAVHAALGMALAAAAIASIALTWRHGRGTSRTLAVLGALAIIGAGFNGASFVNYGHAFSSMIMAGLWALALACYIAGTALAFRAPMQRSFRLSQVETAAPGGCLTPAPRLSHDDAAPAYYPRSREEPPCTCPFRRAGAGLAGSRPP